MWHDGGGASNEARSSSDVGAAHRNHHHQMSSNANMASRSSNISDGALRLLGGLPTAVAVAAMQTAATVSRSSPSSASSSSSPSSSSPTTEQQEPTTAQGGGTGGTSLVAIVPGLTAPPSSLPPPHLHQHSLIQQHHQSHPQQQSPTTPSSSSLHSAPTPQSVVTTPLVAPSSSSFTAAEFPSLAVHRTTSMSSALSSSVVPGGQLVCVVCDAQASGIHYGVPACNGCKTFFRRSIVKRRRFICQETGNCSIANIKRKACRFCRYERCLAVGMESDLVQVEGRPRRHASRMLGRTLRMQLQINNPPSEYRNKEQQHHEQEQQHSAVDSRQSSIRNLPTNGGGPSAATASLATSSATAFASSSSSSGGGTNALIDALLPPPSSVAATAASSRLAFSEIDRDGCSLAQLVSLNSTVEAHRLQLVAAELGFDVSALTPRQVIDTFYKQVRVSTGSQDLELASELDAQLATRWLLSYSDFQQLDAGDKEVLRTPFVRRFAAIGALERTLACELPDSIVLPNNVVVETSALADAATTSVGTSDAWRGKLRTTVLEPARFADLTPIEFVALKSLLLWYHDKRLSADGVATLRRARDRLIAQLHEWLRRDSSELATATTAAACSELTVVQRIARLCHIESLILVLCTPQPPAIAGGSSSIATSSGMLPSLGAAVLPALLHHHPTAAASAPSAAAAAAAAVTSSLANHVDLLAHIEDARQREIIAQRMLFVASSIHSSSLR